MQAYALESHNRLM